MKNKKNLERLFQEQFKDFNENPPEIVWENIQEKLQEKEKKRRVIPIWWRLGGIAALFMLGILGIRSLYDSNTISVENPVVIEKNRSPKNPILIPQENPIKEGENVSQAENENASKTTTNSLIEVKSNSRFEKNIPNESSNQIVNVNTKTLNKKTSLKANNSNQNADKEESMAQSNLAKNVNSTEAKNQKNKSELSSNSNTEKSEKPKNDKPFELIENPLVQQKNTVDSTQTTALAENQVEPNALEELLKEKEEDQKPKVEPKLNRWQISTAVAPVYLGSSSNGSPIDADFANNPKDYKNTISYGLGVNYDVNQKFSLRTGVSNLSLSYATEDVYFYPNINARGITTLNYSSQGAPINVQDFSANNEIQVVQNGAITQQMNYIEVPFELTYKVLDKKFGIQLISGFSTLFLNNNDLMVVSEGFSAQLGEATNLNQIHFSTNVGLGFRYIFWKSFQANFEPTFKYQLNTFSSNDGGFQPYFIGLYSGISYRF